MSELPIGEVPDGWHVERLGDSCSKIGSGATPRGGATVYLAEGTAFIRSQNVYDNEFSLDGLVYIDDDAADQLKGVTVMQGDVLLNITGDSILRTCCAPKQVLPARVSQHVAIIRPESELDSLFLQKYLTLPTVKEYMLGHSSGGTRKAITKGHIESFLVPVPPIDEQRAIAGVLGALDDKIESNLRTGQLTRGLMEAIWQSYALVAPAGHIGDLATKSTIRVGVKSNAVKVLSATSAGKLVHSDDYFEKRVYSKDISKYLLVPQWAFAYNPSRANIGSIGLNHDDLLGAVSPVYVVVQAPGPAQAWWLELALRTPAVRNQIVALSSGGVRQVLRFEDLAAIEIPLPKPAALHAFYSEVESLVDLSHRTESESRILADTRDALLPELLSGRLRVRDAEQSGE